MDRGAWQARVCGFVESEMTEHLTLSISLSKLNSLIICPVFLFFFFSLSFGPFLPLFHFMLYSVFRVMFLKYDCALDPHLQNTSISPLPTEIHKSELVSVCIFSVTKTCLTPQPHGLQLTRLLCPLDFPGKNTGVCCHFLL